MYAQTDVLSGQDRLASGGGLEEFTGNWCVLLYFLHRDCPACLQSMPSLSQGWRDSTLGAHCVALF